MSFVTPPSPSSGGAPETAQYLTLTLDATLTGERKFVPAEGLGATDGGANGNYSLSMTSYVLERSAVSILTSSTVTTTIFNIVIPGNALGSNKSLRVMVMGEATNLGVSVRSWSIAFVLNATTLYNDMVILNLATTPARSPFLIDCYLSNENATNAQFFSGLAVVNKSLGATTGLGDLSGPETSTENPFQGAGAVDSTATMSFACILSGPNVGLGGTISTSWLKRYHVARVL